MRFSRDGKALATLDREARLSIHELGTGRTVHSRALAPPVGPHAAPRRPIQGAISEDLHTVLVADAEGAVRVWDDDSSRLLAVPEEDHGPVSFLEITADCNHGFIIRDRQRVEFWDLRRARRLGALGGRYDDAHVFPVGHRLWIYSVPVPQETVVIWDPTNGQIMEPSPPAFRPLGLAFFPDCHRLAYCPSGEPLVDCVQLVDLDRLIRGPSSIFPPARLAAMAFDPTGQMLAGGGEDRVVRLWDVNSGEELLNFGGHSGPVSLVHFFPDGETLATGAVRPDGATEIFLWGARRNSSARTARTRRNEPAATRLSALSAIPYPGMERMHDRSRAPGGVQETSPSWPPSPQPSESVRPITAGS